MKDDFDEDEKCENISLISHISKNDRWIIDSGCSHHMTGDTSNFERLILYNGNNVSLEMMHHVM